MKDLLRASWILFQVHLLRTVRAKRGIIALLFAALPIGVAVLIKTVSQFEEVELEPMIAVPWFLGIQTVVPLIALVLSSAVIAEEIEDRTITYLFTRPIPRAAILIGRWLAVVLPIVLLVATMASVTVGILATVPVEDRGLDWMPEGFRLRLILAAVMGGVVYSALFASAGALFKRPMLIGLGYTFVVEGFLGNLPVATQKLTVLHYLKSFLFHGYDARDIGAVGEANEVLLATPLLEPGAAAVRLALILVVILSLAAWRFTRREYVLSA